jgi:hypothetical protein
MFRNARLINAGSMLVEQNECGRLWNALFDLQVSAGDRMSKEITHGISNDTQLNRSSGLYGKEVREGIHIKRTHTFIACRYGYTRLPQVA